MFFFFLLQTESLQTVIVSFLLQLRLVEHEVTGSVQTQVRYCRGHTRPLCLWDRRNEGAGAARELVHKPPPFHPPLAIICWCTVDALLAEAGENMHPGLVLSQRSQLVRQNQNKQIHRKIFCTTKLNFLVYLPELKIYESLIYKRALKNVMTCSECTLVFVLLQYLKNVNILLYTTIINIYIYY